jgi:hypothetical protein
LTEKAEEDGVKPQALEQAPDTSSLYVQELLNAFWTLHKFRGEGFSGPAKISLRDIQIYIELYGEPSFDLDLFIRFISLMDTTYRSKTKTSTGASDGRTDKSSSR